MTCPGCGCKDNEEMAKWVDCVDIDGYSFVGYEEIYDVTCKVCGTNYHHIERYSVEHDSSEDIRTEGNKTMRYLVGNNEGDILEIEYEDLKEYMSAGYDIIATVEEEEGSCTDT